MIAVLILALAIWFRPRPSPQPQPQSSVPQKLVKPIAEEIIIKKTSWAPKTISPQRRIGYTRDDVVEFEVVEGRAIAFGDIVLGEVEPDIKIPRGWYQAPRPQLWEDAEIPYFIHPELAQPERVEQALAHFEKYTPIEFVPFEGQPDAIVFEPGDKHCYSYLGRVGGHQPIFLSEGCRWPQIVHELMHALGFIHEHSRTDREEYIEILWDNIDEKHHFQFAMVPDLLMETVKGKPFDFQSVMLYPPTAFAKDPKKPTLRPRQGTPLNPKSGLSQQDIERINDMY